MPGIRRTREQKARDRAEIARLALFGNPTQQSIADKLGLSVATVCRELDALRKEWKAQAQAAVEDIVAQELQKLDALEAEALEQWERSKKDWQKKVVEDKPAGARGGGGKSAKIETGGQCGDPRYLQVILSIQERRAKLVGTDKPSKVAATNPEGTEERPMAVVAMPAQMSAEEWARTFARPQS